MAFWKKTKTKTEPIIPPEPRAPLGPRKVDTHGNTSMITLAQSAVGLSQDEIQKLVDALQKSEGLILSQTQSIEPTETPPTRQPVHFQADDGYGGRELYVTREGISLHNGYSSRIQQTANPKSVLPEDVDMILHMPVFDIDNGSVELIPSRTPGHYHLYLNKVVPWGDYKILLDLFVKHGLCDPKWAEMTLKDLQGVVRVPEHEVEWERIRENIDSDELFKDLT